MKQVKSGHSAIPKSIIIAHLGPAAQQIMSDYEIEIFNASCHFHNMADVAELHRHNTWFVDKTLKTALRKIAFLYSLPSLDEFAKGNLTTQQFLDAPIRYHQFHTRLYHTLINTEVFSLREVIEAGLTNLKQTRGFGVKSYMDILDVLDRKGCGHLFK